MVDLTVGVLAKAVAPTILADSLVSEAGGAVSIASLLHVYGDVSLHGATSGTLALRAPAAAGTSVVTFPAGSTNFSATGGAGRVLKQSTAGGAITVAAIAATEVTGLAPIASSGSASDLSAGIVPSARISGPYTGITGIGTLTTGIWNASTIGLAYGGTQANLSATGGTGQVLRQSTAGGPITVGALTPTEVGVAGAYLPIGGGTLTGSLSISPVAGTSAMNLNSVAGAQSHVAFQKAGAQRWYLAMNAVAESGSNAGSDVSLSRYSDANAFIDQSLLIERATGNVGLGLGAGQLPQAKLHIGAPAGTARIYNGFTDASNGEWAYIGDWSSNLARFGTASNGTFATPRDVSFLRGGVERMRLSSAGVLVTVDTASEAVIVTGSGSSNFPLLNAVNPNTISYVANNIQSGAKVQITNSDAATVNNSSRLVLSTYNSSAAAVNMAAVTAVHTSHAAAAESCYLSIQTREAGVTAERLTLSSAGANFSAPVNATSGSLLVDQIYDHDTVCITQLDRTVVTLANVVFNAHPILVAGKTYSIKGWISVSAIAAAGIRMAFNTTTMTITSMRVNAIAYNGTTVVSNTTISAALTDLLLAFTGVVTDVHIEGSIVVNAAGTLRVQMGQNVANATPTSVLIGSTFNVRRTN